MIDAAADTKPSRLANPRPKVAPFARYRGTSAWRKDRKRVRAYALFLAAANHAPKAVPKGV